MGRKANNLRKRLRIFQEQRTKFYADLKAREVAANLAEERLRKTAAATISLNHAGFQYGDRMMAVVEFHPAMFIREARLIGPIPSVGNISDMAHAVSRQVSEKVREAILQYAAK